MINRKNIKIFRINKYDSYVKSFKLTRRKSILSLIAYLFDKEIFLKKDFSIERISDRAGILSLCLKDNILRELIIRKSLEIDYCIIKVFQLTLGNTFFERLLIFIIHLINPSWVILKISFFNFEEFS